MNVVILAGGLGTRLAEETEVKPKPMVEIGRHPYDVSKSCADMIAQTYAVTYGLPATITRCGNF